MFFYWLFENRLNINIIRLFMRSWFSFLNLKWRFIQFQTAIFLFFFFLWWTKKNVMRNKQENSNFPPNYFAIIKLLGVSTFNIGKRFTKTHHSIERTEKKNIRQSKRTSSNTKWYTYVYWLKTTYTLDKVFFFFCEFYLFVGVRHQ